MYLYFLAFYDKKKVYDKYICSLFICYEKQN